MAKARTPRPDYSRAGVNRDRPAAMPTEGPVLRVALAKAGVASSSAVATLETEVEAAEIDIDDLVTAFAGHIADADPHTGYQKESEKGAADGYAELDGTGKVPVAQLPAGGGGGEANTASNVGTAGVGLWKDKVAEDLRFKKLNAGSAKVTITDDTGNDEVDVDVVDATTSQKGAVELATDGESAANVAVQGNDARMSNARTPTSHATSHQSGGGDAIKLDDLAAPDDNTDLDASTTKHGLCQKFPGGTTNFLRADGTFAAPPGGSAYTLVATLAGDQATGANTTPVTLTGLVFSYAANSVYFMRFIGRVSPAAAGTGCGFQFDLSSTVTEIDVQFLHQLANTGTQSGGHSIADDASVGVSSGMPGTSTYPVMGFAMLRTNGNTGTAQLRFRSETNAVTTCKAGMTLVVEKVA